MTWAHSPLFTWIPQYPLMVPVLEKERQKDPWGLFTSQASQITELQVQWKTLPQKSITWRMIKKRCLVFISGLHTAHTHMWTCMHMHPGTHMCIRVSAGTGNWHSIRVHEVFIHVTSLPGLPKGKEFVRNRIWLVSLSGLELCVSGKWLASRRV